MYGVDHTPLDAGPSVGETGPVSERKPTFIVGPPGVGAETLGAEVSQKLGLSFGDFGDDVVVVPWADLDTRGSLARLRKQGVVLGLWRHPTRILAASGYRCTPTRRFATSGGFGGGTATREFRRLDRGCDDVVMLDEFAAKDVAAALAEIISDLRAPPPVDQRPAEREGLDEWAEDWVRSIDANPAVAARVVDAMARYLIQLRNQGASKRKLSTVCGDLSAAGWIALSEDAPTLDDCLECFAEPPWEFQFRRKFSDSPTAMRQYRANLEGFAQFLVASKLIEDEVDPS